MKGFHRKNLSVSLCGLNCCLCTMKLGGYCPGCGGGDGNQSCKIARCALRHGMEYCCLCAEYPCERYSSADEYDSFITHQNRLRDLQRIREMGPESYTQLLTEKARLLDILLEHYNDGRRKSLYCTAANLLDYARLKAILNQLQERNLMELPLNERAKAASALLEDAAKQQGLALKLRKKPKT